MSEPVDESSSPTTPRKERRKWWRPFTAAIIVFGGAIGYGLHAQQDQINQGKRTVARLTADEQHLARDESKLKTLVSQLDEQSKRLNAITVGGTVGNCQALNRLRDGLIKFARDTQVRSQRNLEGILADPTSSLTVRAAAEKNLADIQKLLADLATSLPVEHCPARPAP